MNKFAATLGALCIAFTATACSAQSTPQVVEQAQVPEPDGAEGIALFKDHKKLETVSCRDFNALDESYRPQAVVYAANYGPKGKPHPTVTVDGVENVIPVVVAQCKAQPGNHFGATVKTAMKAAR
ncbi:HdeA/HdeB family chaperone [uncultured Sphingomonas sp.]|uniref:HdeA/HdeB family chaperone n=1 Tax=uncultured Sphingomonas sp. TaxID=158754 RepID=UPI0025FD1232|nr:HdeA/HdeB family chaperone [uncultured Sphingomonas sp.]